MEQLNIEILKGKTLKKIDNLWDEIHFTLENNEKYRLFHNQSCCEYVRVEDIIGDLDFLIGTPLTMAEEVSNWGSTKESESATWTFYKFATIKGYVTIRCLGESNGCYSEKMDFERIN